MKHRLREFLPLAIVVMAFATSAPDTSADPLRAGLAVVDITPPVGYRMSGYFYERISTGPHDPLQAKAFVLEQDGTRMAWVFCDLVGVPAEVSSAARDQAAKATGIPREHMVIAATHTHTGPLYFGPLRNYFHQLAVEQHGHDPHEVTDYPTELAQKLAEAVTEAANRVSPVQMSAGVGEEHTLAFNRRYVMRDGTVRTNPGRLNPDIVRPAGPVDPEVGILQISRDGTPVAGLTVFALHLDTTGGTQYAADFPYFLEKELREHFGEEYHSLFGIGTCGDINHINFSLDEQQKGHEESERIGRTLAKAVVESVDALRPVSNPSLAILSRIVEVPVQQPSDEEVAAARVNMSKLQDRQLPMLEKVSSVSTVGLNELNLSAPYLLMEIQAFRIGDEVAIVTLPGEIFVELGLEIKRRSPFPLTLIVELANDYPGYIPTRRGFAEGSYEPANSKITPGGGEILVDAAVQLLDDLQHK